MKILRMQPRMFFFLHNIPNADGMSHFSFYWDHFQENLKRYETWLRHAAYDMGGSHELLRNAI